MLTSLAATPKILDKIGPERYLCLSKAEKDLRCPRTFFRDTPTEYIQDAEDTTVPLGGQFNLRLC